MPTHIDITEVPNALVLHDDMPHLNWKVLNHWIDQHVDADAQVDARRQAVSQWLSDLTARLGGDYSVYRSLKFLMLVEPRGLDIDPLLRHFEACEAIIQDHLEGLYYSEPGTRVPLLWFSEIDDYRAYLRYYFPKSLPRRAGGYCIRQPRVHVAIWGAEATLRSALPHELARAFLKPADLPIWLEEGIAEIMNAVVQDRKPQPLADDDRAALRALWQGWPPDAFASGATFFEAGDNFRRSHQLAEALTRLVHREAGDAFEAFVNDAVSADAGRAALKQHLGADLETLVNKLIA